MKGLLQRVSQARVEVEGEIVGSIDQGLLVLVGIEPQDDEASADKLLKRLLEYRVFTDVDGRMNDSLTDVQGGLLLVSQFTLAADTRKGRRPDDGAGDQEPHRVHRDRVDFIGDQAAKAERSRHQRRKGEHRRMPPQMAGQ